MPTEITVEHAKKNYLDQGAFGEMIVLNKTLK
jgi:hypothetical protein